MLWPSALHLRHWKLPLCPPSPHHQQHPTMSTDKNPNAGPCMKCGKIAETGITALGGLFHAECFVCGCGASLVGKTFFPAPDGKSAVCGACKDKGAPMCAKCGKGMNSWTEAMGNKYHPACFVCNKCGGDLSGGFMPLGDSVMCRACGTGGGGGQPSCSGCSAPLMGKFAVKDGKPLCDACMTKASPPTGACSVCSKPVESGIVVMGSKMHPECFVCAGCGTSMNGKSYAQVDGKAMCTDCAAKGAASRGTCCKCSKDFGPTDSITQSLGKLWHPECFTCSKCNGAMGMSGFQVSADGQPVCAKCGLSSNPPQALPGTKEQARESNLDGGGIR